MTVMSPRCAVLAIAGFCALSSLVATAAEPPSIVSSEQIVQQLTAPPGKTKKIGYVPVDGESTDPGSAVPARSAPRRIALPAIEFEFDSDRLTPRAQEQVAELAKALELDSLRPFVFAVQGHTDSAGSREYNRALSLRRANSVKRRLVAERVAAVRLVEVGLGEDFPLPGLAGGDSRNRRVEIVHLGTAGAGDASGGVPPVSQASGGKALLIGIDAYRNVSRLVGPVNDAKAMHRFVTAEMGFEPRDVRLLLDGEATRAAILREIEEWLIGGTRPGDEVFFYFSGHGFQQPDTSGDEPDRFDETLVPVDVAVRDDTTVSGMITDDEIAALLNRLPGRRVSVVVDACHSGTSDRISVVGEAWRYIKSPRRADGGLLDLGTVEAGPAAPAMARETFVSTKDPQLRATELTVWAAVEAHQKALVDEEVRGAPLSVFTRRILSGVGDAHADSDADGVVTRSELHAYLLRESGAYCARHPHRCRRGLTPQLHAAAGAMDAPAFAPAVPVSISAQARAAKDILLGPAPGTPVAPGDRVGLSISQGTRLEVGTELDVVVTSPRDGYLVLLDIDAAGDMVQIFPNEISHSSGAPAQVTAGEPVRVPQTGDPFRLRVSPPAGAGMLVAIVSDETPQLEALAARHKDLSVVERPNAYLVEMAEAIRAGGDRPRGMVATLAYETVMPPR